MTRRKWLGEEENSAGTKTRTVWMRRVKGLHLSGAGVVAPGSQFRLQ
jgi:hypothetical protein